MPSITARTRRGATVRTVAAGTAAAGGAALGWRVVRAFGGTPSGARLERVRRSPHYADGRFHNALPSVMKTTPRLVAEWFFGTTPRRPTAPVPVDSLTPDALAVASDDLRLTWLGHATVLIELEGRRFLTDPVLLDDHAGPGPLGMRRFFPAPVAPAALPPLDAVLVTHDHYDHLGESTVRALAALGRTPRWVAPLGVGARLESWGVPPDAITELDWWEETAVAGVRLVCTPARHFSGRALGDRDRTLWGGFAVAGARRRLYVAGDSGLTPEFVEVGARLGPFDATLIEIGAYGQGWPDIHLGPEQAVAAHQAARGGLMLPVHWATFNLALHGWTEPAERVIVAAERAGVPLALPRPGQAVDVAAPPPVARWWPALPWQTAEEAPIVSSGMPAGG
ncbi:Zn-dependent hydrolase [Gemmatimonadetes bacterium T265]|nr:Zn-dependent hydrolase [Gemmatimonadetes bacterium T265]